jgi:hypothetical protein
LVSMCGRTRCTLAPQELCETCVAAYRLQARVPQRGDSERRVSSAFWTRKSHLHMSAFSRSALLTNTIRASLKYANCETSWTRTTRASNHGMYPLNIDGMSYAGPCIHNPKTQFLAQGWLSSELMHKTPPLHKTPWQIA